MGSFHPLKKVFNPLLFQIFLTIGVVACSQTNEVYNDLLGDYEYNYEGQYTPARLFLQEDTLLCDVGAGITLVLEPVDINSLEFRSEWDGELFEIRFRKDEENQVNGFDFTSGDLVIRVDRILPVAAVRLYPVADIQKDFMQLRKAIEDLHPSLYTFTEKEEFDLFFEEQYNLIDKPLNLESVYKIFASLTTKIGCGHSSVRMPEGYQDNLEGKLFPLKLKFIADEVYAYGTYSNSDSIPNGSKILSINGIPVGKIREDLKTVISADAFSENHINYRLGYRFSLLYSIFYGYPDSFIFIYLKPGESDYREKLIQPVPSGRISGRMEGPEVLDLEIIEENETAVMTISHFAYYDDHERFFGFIDDSFKKIKEMEIKNLVLDIRGNTGGDPFCSVHLFANLANEPVPYFSKPYGSYSSLAEPIPLKENKFDGKLLVLIDGGGLSTTGHFTSLLKYHKIGTFIGEETGATYTCNDASKFFHLKNTRIQVNMPRGTFAAAVKNMSADRGIIPDHYVVQTPEDMANGKDTVMEYAFSLIRSDIPDQYLK